MDVFSLNDFVTGVRFLKKLPSFLNRPISPEEARATLRRRLENRASDFCALMKSAVFENPGSPYLRLLKNAGCGYGDLENMVKESGLEGALRKLLREGVYLTVMEFKGREPVRRGSLVIPAHPSLLRNPLSGRHIRAHSSGSGGKSVPVLIDLDFVKERAVDHLLALEARNLLDKAHAVWGIPGNTDMVRVLELCALGSPPERWFSQVDPESSRLHPRYRWSSRMMRWAGRIRGMKLPAPEHAPLSEPAIIVRWLAEAAQQKRPVHLVTWASSAMRLCQAAKETGIDLSHVHFSIGGEPITEAKLDTIRRTGAAAVPRFMAMECGYIAYGCLKPSFPDELHVMSDMHAVIQPDARNQSPGIPPNALFLSSLRPTAPFILLNVSLGDQAETLPGSCGCPLEKLGWTQRIHRVRSYEKMTSGGMTFLDTDILKVLEEALPSRFGGSLLDYQIVEEEDASGKPRLKLVIDPSLGPLDSRTVADFFLEAIGPGSGAERVMSLQWRESGFLSIERKPPEKASSGKIIHVLKARR